MLTEFEAVNHIHVKIDEKSIILKIKKKKEYHEQKD